MTPRSSATNGFSLVKIPQSAQSSQVQAAAARAGRRETGRKRTDRRSKEAGGAGVDEERIDVGIDVGTRGIGTRSGLSAPPTFSSSVLEYDDLGPGNSQQGSRAAGTVADPPDWNSGSWVMHAPLND